MRQYKISPEGFKEIRRKLLLRSIPVLLIAAIIGIVISSINSKDKEESIHTLPFVIPVIILALGYGIYRGTNRQKVLLGSYVLSITNNLIERRQLNTPIVSIYFNEIKAILKKTDGSFVIKGKLPAETIFIPSQIECYDELEQLLNDIVTVQENATGSWLQKYQGLISLLTLALMATVYIAKNKILVTGSGTILTGILLWSFYEVRRNKNIDNKTKQHIWWVLLVLASIISVTIFKLTM